jgi:glyoxylase-like metal-dependent hydrolase (beta-lactamase superfamily II)
MSAPTPARFSLLTALAVLLWALPLAAQTDWDAVEIRTVPLGGGIYMLMGSGGNIGLSVGDDGAFIVDDQFAPLTEKIKAAIAEVTDHPVEWILNTHWHGDHTGGNENFGGEGALIVAHDNVYKRLNPAEFADLVGRSQQAPEVALPVVTFDETMTFHWNGEDIHAFHVEHAHTDGDVIIHYRGSDVFHMGDTFFNGRYPFIDVDSGGNVDGVIAAADLVLRMSGSSTRLIPGHGELATREDLREYRDMLSTVRGRVAQLVRDGKTQEEAVSARPTADLDEAWGASEEGAERFVTLVYRSLTEGP